MCVPAPACKAALREATERWPGRLRASDGICGDASHQARQSDHNQGNAFDLTHDPAHGVDCHKLADMVKNDTRVKYVIWNRRIWNPSVSAEWRGYYGENAHTKHMHVSIRSTSRGNTGTWFRAASPAPAGTLPPAKPPVTTPFEGDDMYRIDFTVDTDSEGRGYMDLAVDPASIVSVLSNTANPAQSGYKPVPDLARLNVDGKARIVVEEAVPNGRIDLSCWIAG